MSDYEKAQADLNYVLSEDGHSSAAVEKLLGLCDYIGQQEQRIHKLESVNADLYEALRLAVINWLPHDSIYAPEARAALAKARGER